MAKVAVFGTGYWGKNLIRNLHALGALARVVKRSPESREQVAEWAPGVPVSADAAAVLADPGIGAVALATPAETHFELVRRALEAGKDVLVEKPLTLKADEARALVDLAAARGRILMVGHQLEYHPAVERTYELVRAGELGEVRYVVSNRLNWGRFRSEENALWSLAPHDVGLVLGVLGAEPVEVCATGGAFLQPGIADNAVVQMKFPGGARAHLFVSWLHPLKERALVVVGSKQALSFDDMAGKLRLHDHGVDWKSGKPVPVQGKDVEVPFAKDEPLRRECQHFLDCIRERAVPRTDGRMGLRVVSVLDAAQRSLERGGEIVRLGS
ncbi:MAG: Gfo/Idh/MocA family oxidoreductase [Planctomycetota bacterium]|nr:Gfo/Idh/MocA family oxidoreductase [Planctomycetota bacterium]